MIERLRQRCGGVPLYPLFVMFGLNAVDEFDRAAFGVLVPNIKEAFNLDLKGVLSLVGLVSLFALALQVPIAQLADRAPRIPLVVAGATLWAFFSMLTGMASGVIMLGIARAGSSIGKATNDPTHNSLLADYYPVEGRTTVYGIHGAAKALGWIIGPLGGGLIAHYWGWRAPFFVFTVPTLIFVVLALRLREPVRGRWERVATGASDEVAATEEAPASFGESWRTVQKVDSLRRIWWSLPFVATAMIGFGTLASVMYDKQFGLDEAARGYAAAIAEPFGLVGVLIGTRIATRRYTGNMSGLLRFVARVELASSVLFVLFALSPNIYVAVAVNCLIAAVGAIIGPGIFVAFSLAIPARARSTGFSVGALWIIPGLFILPFIGWIGDHWNLRVGMLVMVPLYIIGSFILGSCSSTIDGDIADVWRSQAARSEMMVRRRHGETALLMARGVNAGYGNRQVLFGCDLEIAEGEIVALLGTNGAGKSTLLKAISGIVEADSGAIVLDGRDITHAPPEEIATLGIAQVPGGQGVFAGLTVRENLAIAGWTHRRDPASVKAAEATVMEMFPILAQRLDDAAADLSGGQQQMLALGMAFITRPRVLLIDELSLGLAPVIVGQMLPIIERLAADGVAVVLVEQSVNVALTVAKRAYFLERGAVQFSGPTAELLERPDLLRSVFLSNASVGAPQPAATNDRHTAPRGPGSAGAHDAAHGPLLTINGVSCSFGGIRAVDEVSFDVGRHEIVGIIGPNGAGKTTLFDVLSGFTPAEGGRITLDGVDVTSVSPAQRARVGLGRSFQDARLFPELTVAESLAIATERAATGRSAIAAALALPWHRRAERATARTVDELIELMGLGSFRTSFIRELSTGTRRVVDLACQLAHRPKLVLLDEPSSGIAQREVEALGPLLFRVRDELAASLLVIEHDMPLISSISDRLVALDQGAVVTVGAPADVLAHPRVVESYLGVSAAAIARSGSDTFTRGK